MASNLDTSPLVSVVMPAYNAAGFITEAIESVCAQTYKNWELVIVNDGSTDDTAAVVQAAKLSKKQLQYIEAENAGPGAARNRGIAAAKGTLIAFLDADDVWEPTKLEQQVACLQSGGYDLVFSSGRFFGDNAANHPFVTAKGPYSGPEMFAVLYQHNRIPIVSVLATKIALKKAGLFKEAGLLSRKCEDYDLWLRMAAAGCSFFGMPEKLVRYRLHSASSTHQTLTILQGDLAAIGQFDAQVRSADPGIYVRRHRDLYNRLAAAAAADRDIPLAERFLRQLEPLENAALLRFKMLLLKVAGRRYSGVYHRIVQ
ncbi:MAG TPA: glycosyltransferase family A protein [Candidatus Saccharimonadales bacterium]|nr:glycosyltransferase family A protein [Candidatus Saccharimonadales bacterium]